MVDRTDLRSSTEAQRAELRGKTRAAWSGLSRRKREQLLTLPFVKRFDGSQIFFDDSYPIDFVENPLKKILESLCGSADVELFSSAEIIARQSARRLEDAIRDPSKFRSISFGADIAENDVALLSYFVTTRAFERADTGLASVIIGPKVSGKTAILRALEAKRRPESTISITPEIFATSMLHQATQQNTGLWEEEQAFTSTWIFTILVEVFKRLSENPRGVPTNALKKLRIFLRNNANYQDLDIFTRFIGYLKRIDGVKVGPWELTVKTKMLQELYSLSDLYEIVPGLRGVGGDILILLDELDQGWDNTPSSNKFIAALLQAAIKIQSLGLRVRIVAFLRSEIFDLVKGQLDQLDKLRSSIEIIRWSDGELARLVAERLSHSVGVDGSRTGFDLEIVESLFDGNVGGANGFSYILSRTCLRPREVLQFMRHAHSLAIEAQRSAISSQTILKAEEDFSNWKFEHLCSEYRHIYPKLSDLIWMLRGRSVVVIREDLDALLKDFRLEADSSRPQWMHKNAEDLVQLLYDIEVIGVMRPSPATRKIGILAQFEFAYERPSAAVKSAAEFLVHPALWAALEMSDK